MVSRFFYNIPLLDPNGVPVADSSIKSNALDGRVDALETLMEVLRYRADTRTHRAMPTPAVS